MPIPGAASKPGASAIMQTRELEEAIATVFLIAATIGMGAYMWFYLGAALRPPIV